MSFDRLPSLEAQPTTTRRQDDPHYRDDPEFSQLTEMLSTRLFELTSNISSLSRQISLLGTKRDTERVRERVHDLLEETKEGFKEVGEGVKKVQGWEELNVSRLTGRKSTTLQIDNHSMTGITKVHRAEALARVRRCWPRIPSHPAACP